MNQKHRKYIFPETFKGYRDGISDSYKKGHSVSYVYCACKIGKDHEVNPGRKTCDCIYCKPLISNFKIMPINMDDFERLKFNSLDEKRAFMDKMLADKINEIIFELEDLKKGIKKNV